jgi:ferredoxin
VKFAGISISTGCTFGLYGTCTVKKSAGNVHMVHNGGITEQDIAAGHILACCSHPIGKISIDI